MMHVCTSHVGCFRMPHPNGKGKQQVWFDDDARWGPSAVNMKTGALSPISERHPWFWFAYEEWCSAGRPVDKSKEMMTPNGALQCCVILTPQHNDGGESE